MLSWWVPKNAFERRRKNLVEGSVWATARLKCIPNGGAPKSFVGDMSQDKTPSPVDVDERTTVPPSGTDKFEKSVIAHPVPSGGFSTSSVSEEFVKVGGYRCQTINIDENIRTT